VLRELVKIPGLAQAGLALTNEKRRVLMASLSRIKEEVTEAIVQKMAQTVKGADELEYP
jgi:uncharacterized protein involved in tellurium resistance